MQITNSLMGAGLSAFQNGQQRVEQAATSIASASAPALGNSQAVAELTEELPRMKADLDRPCPELADPFHQLNVLCLPPGLQLRRPLPHAFSAAPFKAVPPARPADFSPVCPCWAPPALPTAPLSFQLNVLFPE